MSITNVIKKHTLKESNIKIIIVFLISEKFKNYFLKSKFLF